MEEGSKSSRITYPQCPQIKSSPPEPDISLSVRRIERFSVVTGPTGIMAIVAIVPPTYLSLEDSFPESQGRINPVAAHVSFLPRSSIGYQIPGAG